MRKSAKPRARPGLAELHKVRHVDPVCCECGGMGRLASGRAVFPHRTDLHDKPFYVCACGARVGCHGGTAIPMGRPAGWSTRKLRHEAHEIFDALWRRRSGRGGRASVEVRRKAYKRLALAMGIDPEDCHFGWFDEAQCRRAIEICRDLQARGAA